MAELAGLWLRDRYSDWNRWPSGSTRHHIPVCQRT
jgi:hypothetical protein